MQREAAVSNDEDVLIGVVIQYVSTCATVNVIKSPLVPINTSMQYTPNFKKNVLVLM